MCLEKTYKRLTHLNEHIRIVHEGRKDYICSSCGKGFGDSKGLKRHRETVHEGMKRFKCHLCTNAYGQSHELKKHKLRAHASISK